MPIIRRLPKVGFNTLDPVVYQVVHLDALNRFDGKATVNAAALKKAQMISSLRKPYKILSRGEITKALTVEANAFSKEAAAKIEKAGGKAVKIAKKAPEASKKG